MKPPIPESSTRLLPLVYDELRRLAAIQLAREHPGQTLQPTALVHEAWLRVSTAARRNWNSKGEFVSVAAAAMRHILVDNARRKARQRHGGAGVVVSSDFLDVTAPLPDDQLLALDAALEELAEQDSTAVALVQLRFFGGLSHTEAAEHLGLSRSAADRLWLFTRAWLYKRVRCSENSIASESPLPPSPPQDAASGRP